MRLKHVLILAFILLSSVPMLLSLQYLNSFTASQYERQTEEQLSALSLIAKKRIESVLDRVKDNIALITSRTQMRISLDQWNNARDVKARNKVHKIINDAKVGLTKLHSISIYDNKGVLVTATADTPNGHQINIPVDKILPSIKLLKRNDQLLMLGIDRLLLNNKVIGYVKVALFADFIVELVNDRTGLGVTGEWLVAQRHDSGDALFVAPLKYDHDAAFKRRVSKEKIDIPITQALLGNERIMRHAPDYAGNLVIASTRYLSELDWGLVVKIEEDEVSQLMNKTKTVIYVSEVIIIIMAVLMGVGVSFYISNPLEKLASHTNKVAQGQFEQYPRSQTWKEVRDLTEHFNYMISSMKELNENLNAKVAERTKELADLNLQLTELSTRDPLTGLHNRRFLSEKLSEEVSRAKRYSSQLTLVILDVDHFKQVNDTWGHDVGDQALKIISSHLSSVIRESDVLARYGGEEFCILLPATEEEQARKFLDRIRMDIEYLKIGSGEKCFSVTCSFGIAKLDDDDTESSLTKKADLALYQAKSDGRNCIRCYSIDDIGGA